MDREKPQKSRQKGWELHMAEEKKQIEEIFEELEEIIAKLESGEGSLEEAFACYEKGIRLVRDCDARLDRVEKQVILLQQEGETNGIS